MNIFIFIIFIVYIQINQLKSQNLTDRGAYENCHPERTCMKISECNLIRDLIHKSCISADRFKTLICGYNKDEPMLCCPDGGKESILPNTTVWSQLNNFNTKPCGSRKINGLNNLSGIGAQPWVARIGFQNDLSNEIKYPCGGSILSNRVILTAAHCALAKSKNYKLKTVLVGEFLSDSLVDCGPEFCSLPAQEIEISHLIIHPEYKEDNYINDLALLILKDSINFTVTAQPICIFEEIEHLVGEYATLAGWGKLAGQTIQPNNQQTLTMPVVAFEKCEKIYSNSIKMASEREQLCVGGMIQGEDACAGFGGSPFVRMHPTKGVFYQIGLLSYGAEQCGNEGYPSVYVNIQGYAKWIRENTPLMY